MRTTISRSWSNALSGCLIEVAVMGQVGFGMLCGVALSRGDVVGDHRIVDGLSNGRNAAEQPARCR